MTQGILRRILKGPLPMHFSHPDDIDRLQALRNAGYVCVGFHVLKADHWTCATVTQVTPRGWEATRNPDIHSTGLQPCRRPTISRRKPRPH